MRPRHRVPPERAAILSPPDCRACARPAVSHLALHVQMRQLFTTRAARLCEANALLERSAHLNELTGPVPTDKAHYLASPLSRSLTMYARGQAGKMEGRATGTRCDDMEAWLPEDIRVDASPWHGNASEHSSMTIAWASCWHKPPVSHPRQAPIAPLATRRCVLPHHKPCRETRRNDQRLWDRAKGEGQSSGNAELQASWKISATVAAGLGPDIREARSD